MMLPFAGRQICRPADGRALPDASLLTNPDENLALIMKDGKIYKNTVK